MSHKSKSRLDHRIQALEAELRLVEGDVKSLTKSVHDPRGKPLPKTKSGRVPLPGEKAPPVPKTEQSGNPGPVTPHHPAPQPVIHTKSQPLSSSRDPGRDFRFATYMSAKGLSYGKASRQERNIQRNKAVLMLIVVVIVLYVVLKLSS